ncbi:MAG: TIGR00730 family Rossman fold protein [Bdellovibrionaceae bacterium]|nr:TIGR00730 family Rossman fold protein [Pseudobdellovibrionaceae bacterium]NUM58285.1 TIGR00730 family Rossman fold protein [Pseudobdellovibrionaceae bacterium]
MKSVTLFCGARLEKKEYEIVADEFCEWIIRNQLQLVYGGGSTGVMGYVAKKVVAAGLPVVGVIPEKLVKLEVAYQGCTELIIVNTMHERKQIMADRADSFIALPGGFGTLDEICEIITWKQLKIHDKPIGFLNGNGYFDGFYQFAQHGVKEGFISAADLAAIQWLKNMNQFVWN